MERDFSFHTVIEAKNFGVIIEPVTTISDVSEEMLCRGKDVSEKKIPILDMSCRRDGKHRVDLSRMDMSVLQWR